MNPKPDRAAESSTASTGLQSQPAIFPAADAAGSILMPLRG